MDQSELIPAAQYLRMSTEDQQYSFANQRDEIRRYAKQHGYLIVKSYEDAARSGVVLKYRNGLRSLLEDVMGGRATFRAILVYDSQRLMPMVQIRLSRSENLSRWVMRPPAIFAVRRWCGAEPATAA
jgi:DNA invertase Pin-like site-specific DNA recombinase